MPKAKKTTGAKHFTDLVEDALLSDPRTYREIGESLGVTHATLHNLIGKTYKPTALKLFFDLKDMYSIGDATFLASLRKEFAGAGAGSRSGSSGNGVKPRGATSTRGKRKAGKPKKASATKRATARNKGASSKSAKDAKAKRARTKAAAARVRSGAGR